MASIISTRLAMGYQFAGERMACKNCQEVETQTMAPYAPLWYCKAGGFHTTAMAICQRHKPSGPTSTEASMSGQFQVGGEVAASDGANDAPKPVPKHPKN